MLLKEIRLLLRTFLPARSCSTSPPSCRAGPGAPRKAGATAPALAGPTAGTASPGGTYSTALKMPLMTSGTCGICALRQ